MGAYSRWALIRGWALIRINTVFEDERIFCTFVDISLACEQAPLFGQAKRASRERASAPRGFAARSRVLARLVSLAQTGELARRLISPLLRPKMKEKRHQNGLMSSN